MGGKYQAYSEYKDSDIGWLGKMPSHWRRAKFKFLSKKGKAFASGPFGSSIGSKFYKEIGIPVIRGNNLSLDGSKPKYIDDGYVYLTVDKAKELSNAEVVPGDLVFTARGTVGQVGLIPDDDEVKWTKAILSANQLRFRNYSDDCSSNYLWYLFSSWFVRTQVILSSDSVAQPNLNLGSLKDLQLLLPCFSEQEKIANFLDHETAKIDTLIEKQQQLIKLLKEKRQAVISYAVTKGLNPDAPMRDSGVEWFGEVPKHWMLTRAKYLFEEQDRPVREQDGIVTVFRDGQVCLRSKRRTDGFTLAVLEHGYQGIRKGDLVLHSMDAFAGAIGVSEDDGRSTPEYVVTVPFNKKTNCEYYADLLRLMAQRDFIFVLCPSVRERAPRFRYSKFQEVLLPEPPCAEQTDIAKFIKSSNKRYMELQEKASKQILLLQERRVALISAAVTGKIDVRHWKKPEQELSNKEDAA